MRNNKLKYSEDQEEIFSRDLLDFLSWYENNRAKRDHLILSSIIDEYMKFEWRVTRTKILGQKYFNK